MKPARKDEPTLPEAIERAIEQFASASGSSILIVREMVAKKELVPARLTPEAAIELLFNYGLNGL